MCPVDLPSDFRLLLFLLFYLFPQLDAMASGANGSEKVVEVSDTIYIVLEPATLDLELVEIRASRLRQPLISDELSGQPLFTTRGMSLAHSLEGIGGVRTLSTGHGIAKPVINGLHSSRVVVVNQGVRLESQQWGSDHAPEVDPFMADRLEVIRGAASVRYGPRAIGGVVLIKPHPVDDSRRLHGNLHMGAFSNNAMGVVSARLEGMLIPSWNINWRLQGTMKRGATQRIPGHWVANTALQESSWLMQVGQNGERFSWTAMISHYHTRIGLYPGAHADNLDDLFRAIDSEEPLFKGSFSYRANGRPQQQANHLTAKWTLDYRWNNRHLTTLLLSHQENRRDEFDARSFIGLPELSLEMGTTATTVTHKVFLPHDLIWDSGMDVSFQQNINHPSSARIFIRNYQSLQPGLFSILQWERSRVWIYELGLRYDYQWFESYYRQGGALTTHERIFNQVSATAGTIFRPRESLSLTANLASAWRPPSPNELYANGLHQGVAGIEHGNPDFYQERSTNISILADWQAYRLWGLRSSLGVSLINNYIYLQPVLPPALTINGYYPRFDYQQTDARITTANLALFYKPLPRWRLDLEAEMLWARDLKNQDWIVMMPADRFRLSMTWNPFTSRASENAYLTVALQHTSKQNRIPRKTKLNAPIDYAPPPNAYTLLHVDAGWINPSTGTTWGVSVYNATNVNYHDYMNRMRYFIPESGVNVALRVMVPINT